MSSIGKTEQPSAAKSVEVGTHKKIEDVYKKQPSEEPGQEKKSVGVY